MIDLFGLEQPPRRKNDRPEAASVQHRHQTRCPHRCGRLDNLTLGMHFGVACVRGAYLVRISSPRTCISMVAAGLPFRLHVNEIDRSSFGSLDFRFFQQNKAFMTRKNTKTDTPANSENCSALQRSEADIETHKNYMARVVMSPEFSAASVVDAYNREGKLDVFALMAQLEAQHASLAADSLAQAENMLMSQAVALQAIFTKLAVRAMSSNGEDQIQCMLGLALRAQSGSRATLQTLGELKNPRHTTFVKQANIAQGAQQVNNGVATAPSPSTRVQEKFPDSTNKLSGANHELLEDARAAGQAIAGYPVVATVEKVHRAKVRRR